MAHICEKHCGDDDDVNRRLSADNDNRISSPGAIHSSQCTDMGDDDYIVAENDDSSVSHDTLHSTQHTDMADDNYAIENKSGASCEAVHSTHRTDMADDGYTLAENNDSSVCSDALHSTHHTNIADNRSATEENDNSSVCNDAFHSELHSDMSDDNFTEGENTSHCSGSREHSPIDLDDNAVDLSEGLFSLPVCTSTPCPPRCQSRLLDSHLQFVSPEDSAVGPSLHACISICSSIQAPAQISSLSGLSTIPSKDQISGLPSSQTGIDDPSRSVSLSVLSSDTNSGFLNSEDMEATSTPTMNDVQHKTAASPAAKVRNSSTPLCLSWSALCRQHGVAAITPPDGDSPITGHDLQPAQDLQTGDGSALSGPLFRHHRASTAPTTSLNFRPLPPPQWDSPSQPSWADEESEDEAYFSASRLSLTPYSIMDEESNQSLGLVQRMQRVLSQFTPPLADRLVGRQVGVEHVDIVMGLYQRDLPACGVIAWLRPYLQPSDYVRMCGVSQQWRHICLEDKVISRYWKLNERLHARPEEKENKVGTKGVSGDNLRCLTRASGCLGDVQATAPPPPVKHIFSSPDLYEKARKSLRWEELLRHCPLCQSVAKVVEGQERAHCQNPSCHHDFCTRCLTFYHYSLPCPVHSQAQRHPPGSKKSKKHLKRISNLL